MDVRVRFRSVTIFGVALQHSKSYPDCMAWLAALSLVIVLAAPGVVDACSCVERVPCQTFWSADAVFTGVVTSVTWSGDQKQARSHTTIIVERGFKGESGQIVLTGIGMSTCRYDSPSESGTLFTPIGSLMAPSLRAFALGTGLSPKQAQIWITPNICRRRDPVAGSSVV